MLSYTAGDTTVNTQEARQPIKPKNWFLQQLHCKGSKEMERDTYRLKVTPPRRSLTDGIQPGDGAVTTNEDAVTHTDEPQTHRAQ